MSASSTPCFNMIPKKDVLLMNPEFEYAYGHGYGVEVELPTENAAVEACKVALQGTFNFLNTRKFIHGWQYIGEYLKHTKEFENDRVYICLDISAMKTGVRLI